MTLEIESGELDECPYCGSTNLEADSPDPDIGSREKRCLDCHRHWNEGFVFTTIYIPAEYENIYKEHAFIKKQCKCGTVYICPIHEEGYNK